MLRLSLPIRRARNLHLGSRHLADAAKFLVREHRAGRAIRLRVAQKRVVEEVVGRVDVNEIVLRHLYHPNVMAMERLQGPTPSGGVSSEVFFYNERGECEKSEATRAIVRELDADGNLINETWTQLTDTPAAG